MALPPSRAGAAQATVAWPLPAVAVTCAGASGRARVVPPVLAVALSPAALCAARR